MISTIKNQEEMIICDGSNVLYATYKIKICMLNVSDITTNYKMFSGCLFYYRSTI